MELDDSRSAAGDNHYAHGVSIGRYGALPSNALLDGQAWYRFYRCGARALLRCCGVYRGRGHEGRTAPIAARRKTRRYGGIEKRWKFRYGLRFPKRTPLSCNKGGGREQDILDFSMDGDVLEGESSSLSAPFGLSFTTCRRRSISPETCRSRRQTTTIGLEAHNPTFPAPRSMDRWVMDAAMTGAPSSHTSSGRSYVIQRPTHTA